MSFFDTEEAHAVMLAYAADRGGRAAFQVMPTPLDVEVCAGDGRPPGSSGKSRLEAPAQFGAKKDIHILHCCFVKQNRW
jgi:hypothetical protein